MKIPNNPRDNHLVNKINKIMNHNKAVNSNKVTNILKTR